MNITSGLTSYKSHLKMALKQMKSINNYQYKFLLETFGLFLGVLGRLNFLQLERYGQHCEQHYRNQFEKPIDFMELNSILIKSNCSSNLVIAFDPSYIPKSGKKTPHLGFYWSGVAKSAKWGLEIGGLAAIDIDNHSAFHLDAIQTEQNYNGTLLEQYAFNILKHKENLKDLSKYIVVDAYFSKYSFTKSICDSGFELVSRLRTDAHLQYAFLGEPKKGKGRPKMYDGKVDYKSINLKHFKEIKVDNNEKIYQAKLYSKSLKRWINLVIVYSNRKGKWTHKNYFSTDLTLKALTLLEYYRSRFQIEFLYRDAKQHTSLSHCQARSDNKLYSHFNIALTTVNLAKITHWMSLDKQERGPFSMSDVKTYYSNELHINRFIKGFGIFPNSKKNKTIIRKLKLFGKIAA